MDSNTLFSALKYITSCSARGYKIYVLASDEFDKIKHCEIPALVVFNTDPSYLYGSHWIAMFLESSRNSKSSRRSFKIDLFDPIGKNLSYYNINLPSRFEIVNQNTVQFQSSTSNSCGLFCLFYLANRVQGFGHDYVLRKFSKVSKRRNDLFVRKFYKSLHLSFCVVKCKGVCCQVSRY